MTPRQLRIFTSSAFVGVLGCASTVPPPNGEWAAAQADVGRAEESGAASVPDAKLHLQQALEDLAKSKQVMGEDNKRAASLCNLASAEARLARSLAKQAAAQKQAREAEDDVQRTTGGDTQSLGKGGVR